MPYFFLSYAQVDSDGYLDKFYSDLCEAVRARTGLGPRDIGFRDQSSLEIGTDWPTGLAEVLASTRVFVAVCSPSYFASDLCGREWQLFTELRKPAPSDSVGQAATLLPITWIPTATLPEVARRLQHFHEDLGEVYKREGVHFLSRLNRFRDDYQTFVTRLAERIVAAGEHPAPRPDLLVPDLESAPNAFLAETAARNAGIDRVALRPTGSTLPEKAHALATGGPRHVNFVVVAAPAHELAQLRRETHFYGPTPHDWAPYRPLSTQRICVFAQNIASTRDLTSALETAEQSIIELLVRARENNEVVVLIVDVWTTKLDPYYRVLTEYDERNAPTSAIMVPWNEADDEMHDRFDELRAALSRALPNNTARADPVFRSAIPTLEKFQEALEEVLAEVQSRIFHFGLVARRAGGDRIVERPVLSPPREGRLR